MPSTEYSSNVAERLHVDEPDMYDVIMLNDDFTTQDFVVDVIMRVFFKKEEEATQLMMKIHHKGSAIVGTYTYDIAVSKTNKALLMAREEGFPLRINVKKRRY